MGRKKNRKGSPLSIILLLLLVAFLSSLFYKIVRKGPSEPIRVEVLNACGVSKLARRTTEVLRDMGFDVVYYGNATTLRNESVVVERYSKDRRNAKVVARALGIKQIIVSIDTTGIAQVSVIIGKDYKRIKKLNRREFVL
ncbi:MAG TPA: LytR family transcriptional regulator [candidate division WOR-3 bacterium]|uniref:LytR family transcriptional regulator n=1 Tax=candidate division WOR-3 bacterium TaxID=2052148 RepID=A0A7C0ZIN4_UNCW3|nr:LytR family transcriptional regulator [candidate division WOR-3 bacterium]